MPYCFKRDKPLTSKPTDWPQGKFKDKNCRDCGSSFKLNSPCNLYCSDICAARGKTSAYLQRNYSISLDDYDRMNRDQNFLCKICRSEGFVMKDHHKLLLVVDHCHSTGKVRGLLCHNCNRALGLLQDSLESLERAKNYLEGATTIESTSKDGSK